MIDWKTPEKWQDVTLGKWREIHLLKEEDEEERLLKTAEILLEKSKDEIRGLTLPELKSVLNRMQFVSERIYDGVCTEFELDGVTYGIIPKMDAQFISAGEFLDIESWKKEPVKNIHFIAALIYRPIIMRFGSQYRIEPYTLEGFHDRADLFLRKLPITKVHSAVLFFSAYSIQFTEIMLRYLKDEEKTTKRNQMKKNQKVTKKRRGGSSSKRGAGMI